MRKDACTASGGLYRPRQPRASPLHQCRAVSRRILKHLRLWDPKPRESDHPGRDPPWPAHTTIPLTYHSLPDSA